MVIRYVYVCVVIEDEEEKKRCRKCRCWRVLELYRGENATCNICLGYTEKWAKKNAEKVREMNKNYREDMKDDIKEKKKAYSQIEIDCGVCGCKVRKCKWNRHVKTKKHILGVDGENNCVGDCDGEVGWKVTVSPTLLYHTYRLSMIVTSNLCKWISYVLRICTMSSLSPDTSFSDEADTSSWTKPTNLLVVSWYTTSDYLCVPCSCC